MLPVSIPLGQKLNVLSNRHVTYDTRHQVKKLFNFQTINNII